jgi:hypothetical protein
VVAGGRADRAVPWHPSSRQRIATAREVGWSIHVAAAAFYCLGSLGDNGHRISSDAEWCPVRDNAVRLAISRVPLRSETTDW